MARIFISHRSCDTTEAERLAIELRNTGHDVWIDKWMIDIGNSITQKMNEGLEIADYVIVCYSSQGIMSPWMSIEWLTTLARQLDGVGVKILPVILSGDRIPAILSGIKYADLRSNWSEGMSEILRAIGT
ncbi:MAG: toll/interleukin-1 receptor domain-containing protein [Spirochaetota bacterium]|nr:toll/interleukin-1 receptor domain-containing protein [Spirochaetota bacterium]